MVESGDIRAKIESPAGTVHFQEDMHVSSSATVTSRLEADLQTTADLTERVRKLEARLMTNPVFIQKVCSVQFQPPPCNVFINSGRGRAMNLRAFPPWYRSCCIFTTCGFLVSGWYCRQLAR